jgi:hypothetical protein
VSDVAMLLIIKQIFFVFCCTSMIFNPTPKDPEIPINLSRSLLRTSQQLQKGAFLIPYQTFLFSDFRLDLSIFFKYLKSMEVDLKK